MCRVQLRECGEVYCTRLLPGPNDRCRGLQFQALLIAGGGRAVAAITPAE